MAETHRKGRPAVAGDRQTPSGTAFDPSPQFWVHEVERLRPLTVTGRCWFAPVSLGTIFDTLVAGDGDDSRWPGPCHLRVEEISAYGHLLDELDQTVSARLILSGVTPQGLVPGSILVSRASPAADDWQWPDWLWLRRQG
jgi:hypothetical protein